jgi:hypothetical protein
LHREPRDFAGVFQVQLFFDVRAVCFHRLRA